MPSVKPSNPIIDWGNPITKSMIVDMPMNEKRGLPRNLAKKNPFSFDGMDTNNWNTGIYGSQLKFEGSDRLLANPTNSDSSFLNVQNGLTIQGIWQKTSNTSDQFDFLCSHTKLGGSPRKFYITTNSTSLECRIRGTSTNYGSNISSIAAEGRWMHTIMTYDFSYMRVWCDGVLKLETAATEALLNDGTLDQFSIGRDRADWGGGDLNGNIALFRMWDRGLKPEEAKQLYIDPWCIYQKPKFRFGYQTASSSIKKFSSIAQASIKKVSGITLANIKKISGVAD